MHSRFGRGIDPTNPKYTIVDRIEVPTLPMAMVLKKYVGDRPIHFIKVDVEGHESAVLRGCDFRKYRPIVLVIRSDLSNDERAEVALSIAFLAWIPSRRR